jgi:hypothetical protein
VAAAVGAVNAMHMHSTRLARIVEGYFDMIDICMHCQRAFALFARGAVALAFVSLTTAAVQAAAMPQPTFSSADAAATALIEAVKGNQIDKALAILGPGTEQWVRSGDPVQDKEARDAFITKYDQKHGIEQMGDKSILVVGSDDWPFAFPILQTKAGWRFDAAAGKQELLARRIGANELAAINVLLAVVDAQRDYSMQDHDKDGVREYARRFASTPGKRDGLYWQTAANEPPSPLGELMARASTEGYGGKGGTAPFHGYYFRMLTAQGPKANGGALDYIARGHMIGGFAVIAWPAQYGNSGVMTFMVNHDGVVYQKDLGASTDKVAHGTTRFDPGPGWTQTKAD